MFLGQDQPPRWWWSSHHGMSRYTHHDVGSVILTVPMHMVLSTNVYIRTYEGVNDCIATRCDRSAGLSLHLHNVAALICTPTVNSPLGPSTVWSVIVGVPTNLHCMKVDRTPYKGCDVVC